MSISSVSHIKLHEISAFEGTAPIGEMAFACRMRLANNDTYIVNGTAEQNALALQHIAASTENHLHDLTLAFTAATGQRRYQRQKLLPQPPHFQLGNDVGQDFIRTSQILGISQPEEYEGQQACHIVLKNGHDVIALFPQDVRESFAEQLTQAGTHPALDAHFAENLSQMFLGITPHIARMAFGQRYQMANTPSDRLQFTPPVIAR